MKFKILTLLFAFLAVACEVNAQATLSVQGTIQRSFGGAVDDGKYSLTFKLYTQESGGTPVWSETQDDIEVIGGVYSALLGEANPLTAGFNEVYYLGIAVDGGAELIPRTRLTSAPYALSLIGQSNTFPSAGAVGIGTVTPQTKLHVHDDDNVEMRITTLADKGASMRLNAGDKTSFLSVNQYAFGIGSENLAMNISANRVHLYESGSLKAYTFENGLVVNGKVISSVLSSVSGQDMVIQRAEDTHIICRGDGWTEFRKALWVPGTIGQYIEGGHLRYSIAGPQAFVNQGHGVSIRTAENVMTTGLVLISDARVKKNFHSSNGFDDLSTLMKLEVTDYSHVDTLSRGIERVKGFIAQQVEKVYPQAVTTSYNFVPDIYTKPSSVNVDSDKATFHVNCGHHLVVGDMVRIFSGKETDQHEYSVISTDGDKSFTVSEWQGETNPERIFVYGKGVSDFRTVEYDRIHTLNVSATQELARRVAQLEAANAGLQLKNNELQQLNEGLRGDVNGLNDRLTKLEKLLTADSKR
jgi:hypothetical protein